MSLISSNSHNIKFYVIVLLFIPYLFLWPNILFNYSENIVAYVKIPYVIAITFFLLTYSISKSIKVSLFFYGLVLILIATNYSLINTDIHSGYFHRALLLILFSIFFYHYQFANEALFSSLIFVSVILSIIALLAIALTIYDFNIDYKLVEIIEGSPKNINLFFGIENDINQLRSSSFFHETNKFAYFLSPALVVMFFLRKIKVKNYVFFCILLLAAISTFSFFLLISCLLTYLLSVLFISKKNQNIGLNTLEFFLIFFILGLSVYYLHDSEYFIKLTNKQSSFDIRMQGILSSWDLITDNIFGLRVDEIEIEGNTTSALIFWLLRGGIQGFLLLTIFLVMTFRNNIVIMKSDVLINSAIGHGIFVYFLQQTFYGQYFEYQFIVYAALMAAYYEKNKGRVKKKCV
jgi:hypothetical protein